jgi:hypothetical protein
VTHRSCAFSLHSIAHDPRSKFLFRSLVVLSHPFSISLFHSLSLSSLILSRSGVTVLSRSRGCRAREQHRTGQPGWRLPSRQAVGLLSSFSLSLSTTTRSEAMEAARWREARRGRQRDGGAWPKAVPARGNRGGGVGAPPLLLAQPAAIVPPHCGHREAHLHAHHRTRRTRYVDLIPFLCARPRSDPFSMRNTM